jgi:membrane carboxypeptidase/penicillin-binding protein
MRRRAASIAIGLAAACFALLAYVFLTLPDVRPLATRNPATTAFIELRAREAADQGRKARRVQRWVRYEAVSANLRKAVLVAEDDAFWTHDGVDVEQLKESIEANLEKGKAALLAGAIINPRVHSPAHPTPRLRRRQQIILRRMGLVTPPEEAPEVPEPPPPMDQLEAVPQVTPPDDTSSPDRRPPDAQPLPPPPSPPDKSEEPEAPPPGPQPPPSGAKIDKDQRGEIGVALS